MTYQQQIDHFDAFVETMRETMLKKGNDYAQEKGDDRLSNFKFAGQICGITPMQQCLALVATKVARLGTLLSKEGSPNNESIQDSVLDLANYAVLLSMLEVDPLVRVFITCNAE